MKTSYIVQGYMAIAELDNYEDGCHGQSQMEFLKAGEWNCKADTLKELVQKLNSEFNGDDNSVLLNSCEKLGRIDIQVWQRQAFECSKPSAKTLENWKAGKIDLYLTTYIFNVQQVTIDLDLQTIFDSESA